MKKIIYSLVIMIAAGSLFTSCVNYDEPVGVQDLREAKASYLDALSGLRAADAEVRKAVAAFTNAQAEMEKANAAYRNAEVEYRKLLNDAQATTNAEAKAKAEKAIAQYKADVEKAAVDNAKALAEAQQLLENMQKKIAAEALALTQAEQTVLDKAITNYKFWLGEVARLDKNVQDKQEAVWNNKFGSSNIDETAAEIKARWTDSIADAKAEIKSLEETKAGLAANQDYAFVKKTLEEFVADTLSKSYDKQKNSASLEVMKLTTIKEAEAQAREAWAEWYNENYVAPATPEAIKKAWALPTYANSLIGFVTTLNTYLGYIDAGVDVVEAGTDSIRLTNNATYDKVLKVVNGDEESANEFKAMGVKGMVELIESKDILKADSTAKKNAEKAFADADSAYKHDLAILKAGRKAFLDADTLIEKAVKDTVKKDSILTAKKAALTQAITDSTNNYKADSANAVAFSAALQSVVNNVAKLKGQGTLSNGVIYSEADAKALLDTVQAYVAAKVALVGPQSADTIKYFKTDGMSVTPAQKAIAELTLNDLAQAVDSVKFVNDETNGDYAMFKVKNIFTQVISDNDAQSIVKFVNHSYEAAYKLIGINNITVSTDWMSKTAAQADATNGDKVTNAVLALAALSRPNDSNEAIMDDPFSVIFRQLGLKNTIDLPNTGSAVDFWGGVLDINSFIVNVGEKSYYVDPSVDFALVGYPQSANLPEFVPADYTEAIKAKHVADSTSKAAETAFTNSKNDLITAFANSINAFDVVYNKFFDPESPWMTTYDKDSYDAVTKDAWKAFDKNLADDVADLEYFVEKFGEYASYDFISGQAKASEEMLEEIANQMGQFKNTFGNAAAIEAFVYGTNNNSEYAKLVKVTNDKAVVENQKDAIEILAELKAIAEEAETLANESKAELDEANKANNDYKEAAFGINEEASTEEVTEYNTPFAFVNNTTNILAGKAPKAGQQKAIYDKYLKAAVDAYLALDKENKAIEASIANTRDLINAIEPFAVAALEVENGETSKDKFVEAYEAVILALNNKIDAQNNKIDEAEWTIAQIDAGVDSWSLKVAIAERNLKQAQDELALAQEQLAFYKAQYDAVMAKYVK